MNCPHPSFAIVYEPKIFHAMIYQLFCYECGEEMPFFMYRKKDWKSIKGPMK